MPLWSKSVIDLLQMEGFIVAGSIDKLEKEVTTTRNTEGLWVPNDEGTFI